MITLHFSASSTGIINFNSTNITGTNTLQNGLDLDFVCALTRTTYKSII